MKAIWTTILLITISSVSAQKSRLSKLDSFLSQNIENSEGTIYLNDGKELRGLLGYNDRTGILKFEKGNDSRSLTARSVMAFEVYDPFIDENRIFYSLPGIDSENGAPRLYFFELLQDFKTFAVLSRKEPLTVQEKKGLRSSSFDPARNLTSTNSYSRDKVIVQQIETFYFLRPREDPQPYFSVIVETNDKKSILTDGQKTKEKFVDKNLMQEFVGELYPKLEQYAMENKLSFKDRSDFIKILEYLEILLD